MDIATRKSNNLTIVDFNFSSLDAGTATEFKSSMAKILDSDTHFVFNLENLKFIDSSGLGAILSCLKTVAPKGGEIKLCNLSKSARIIIELVNMHKVFEIYNTVEEGVRSFA
ncbi:MAG: STAS domain-containing protein [Candidatus Rifleibacteriota bacterium]